MGYLNNSSIVVDAILTRKGRELLAKGQNEFNITHYALADDEIDYTLWNPDHPLGSAYYGAVIEAMPITEAVPDETQVMRYKLVTLPKNTVRIPVVTVPNNSITLLVKILFLKYILITCINKFQNNTSIFAFTFKTIIHKVLF